MVMLGCKLKPGHYLELLWLIQLLTVVSGVTAPSSKVCKIKWAQNQKSPTPPPPQKCAKSKSDCSSSNSATKSFTTDTILPDVGKAPGSLGGCYSPPPFFCQEINSIRINCSLACVFFYFIRPYQGPCTDSLSCPTPPIYPSSQTPSSLGWG